jgi:hypothetical protein
MPAAAVYTAVETRCWRLEARDDWKRPVFSLYPLGF